MVQYEPVDADGFTLVKPKTQARELGYFIKAAPLAPPVKTSKRFQALTTGILYMLEANNDVAAVVERRIDGLLAAVRPIAENVQFDRRRNMEPSLAVPEIQTRGRSMERDDRCGRSGPFISGINRWRMRNGVDCPAEVAEKCPGLVRQQEVSHVEASMNGDGISSQNSSDVSDHAVPANIGYGLGMGSSSPVKQSCAAIGGSQVPADEKEPQEDKECDTCVTSSRKRQSVNIHID